MGRVYLGRPKGSRAVAVKVVRPERAEDADFRRRFAREGEAARRVNALFPPGVVDADPEDAPAWLATVYVPGVPLGEAVAAHGPLPKASVAALGAGLAEALEAIHAAGVIHRDLKPSNKAWPAAPRTARSSCEAHDHDRLTSLLAISSPCHLRQPAPAKPATAVHDSVCGRLRLRRVRPGLWVRGRGAWSAA
jgi:hypothetical protein